MFFYKYFLNRLEKSVNSSIYYTGNSQTAASPFAHIELTYEPRPENSIDRYDTAFRTLMKLRLNRINIYVDTVFQRRYDLTYAQSARTKRSLLKTITQYGADGLSTLPPVTFSYQENASAFNITLIDNASAGDKLWNYRYAGDFDRGHDNFGSMPAGGFDVNWGPTNTQASGSNWNIDATGKLTFSSPQDAANWFWTYLYVTNPVTLSVPFSSTGVIGTYINGDYSATADTLWDLKAGYNLVEITAYHQHESFNFDLNYALSSNVDLMNSSQIIVPQMSADFNADTFVDIATFDDTTGTITVLRSSGEAFLPEEQWISGFGTSGKLVLGDFNRDGRTDVCAFTAASGTWQVALSDGSQFVDSGVWANSFGVSETPSAGDFNGDGLTDIMTFFNSGGSLYARIALNTGSNSFTPGAQTILVGNSGDNGFTADFNGDGQVDFGSFDRVAGNWQFRLNTGDPYGSYFSLPSITGFGADRGLVINDFNQDGLTDIGYYEYTTGKIIYRLSTGTDFGSNNTSSFTFSFLDNTVQIQPADFNGDTLTDFAAYSAGGDAEIAFSNGNAPDLLSSVDNGLGAQSVITYGSVSEYGQTFLPFPIQVVKAVAKTTSLGDYYSNRSYYANGLWDAEDREFRGFGLVKNLDDADNYSETVFLQDDIYKGRISEQRSYDAAGNLYSKVTHTWDVIPDIYPGVNFIYLKRKDNFVYDGDSTGRRTAEEFYYEETPQLGALTRAVQLGEVDLTTGLDIGTDQRTVETAYVNNTIDWLIGLPREVIVKDTNNTIVRKTWFYYDNNTNTAPPVKGLLTKKEDWAGDAPEDVNPVTQYTYDTYGNLKTTTDPMNNVTSITYDTDYNIFPLTTTNALNHQVSNQYYGVEGVPMDGGDGYFGLWGQLKSTTDPNAEMGQKSYDTFGRPIASVAPLDTIALPTVTTSYATTSTYSMLTTQQRVEHGQPETIDQYVFSDGLGRHFLSTARTATANQYIASSQTAFNERGLPIKKYIPRFIDTVFAPLDPTQPHSIVEYDPMGRAIKTTNTKGYYASVQYDDWNTSTINENGHKQESEFDAYGRLIRKIEYNGADGRGAPHYPAVPYTPYATTLYTYDSEGNLTQTEDAHGTITTITYDYLGRKISMNDPDMGVWQYKYDLNGNLIEQTDAKNQVITFTYDVLNRLTNKTDGGSLNVDYTYDDPFVNYSKGRLTEAAYSPTDKTQFVYDSIGREIESIKTINQAAYNVGRDYDALNRLTKVQYPNQQNIFYRYNSAGQIESIVDEDVDGSGENSFQYNPEIKLILLFDNDAVTDSTGNHTFNALDNAQRDATINVFGTASLNLDGNGDYLQTSDSPDWDIISSPADNWTVDLWVRHDMHTGTETYISHFQDANNFWEFAHVDGEGLKFQAVQGGSPVLTLSGGEITDGLWHHVALSKVGDRYGIYKDGIQVAHVQTSNTTNFSGALSIGSRDTANYLDGNIYAIRVMRINILEANPSQSPVTDPSYNFTANGVHTYAGGTGANSIDGNFNTAQEISIINSGTVTNYIHEVRSEHDFGGEYYVNTIKFRLRKMTDTDDYSAGSYGAWGWYKVSIFENGKWVPIVYQQQDSLTALNPTVRVLDSGEVTLIGGWANVSKIKAEVYAFLSSDHDQHVETQIYEIQAFGPKETSMAPSDIITPPAGPWEYFAFNKMQEPLIQYARAVNPKENSQNTFFNGTVAKQQISVIVSDQRERGNLFYRRQKKIASSLRFSQRHDGRILQQSLNTFKKSITHLYTDWIEPYVLGIKPAHAETNDFVAQWAFNEGVGSLANDTSGNNNHGTLINMTDTNWVAGKINQGLDFDGTNEHVEIPKNFSVSNNFTMSLWVSPESTHEIDAQSTSGGGGTSGQRYAISPPQGESHWGSGHSGIGISVGTNGISVYEHAASYMPPVLVYSGTITGWNHVVIIYENKTPKLYLNGTLVATGLTSLKSFVHPGPAMDIYSGMGGMIYGYFDGQMDDVRIYDRVLLDTEISDIFNEANNTSLPTVSLTADVSTVIAGEPVNLTWTSANADTCTASDAWTGNKSLSGSEALSPLTTSTYLLTCTNTFGSAFDIITVKVISSLTDSLSVHWNFDELSGTVARDSLGTKDGTLFNMTDEDWVAGKINNGLDFDGINDYVKPENIMNGEIINNFAVSLWVSPESTHQIDAQSTVGALGTSGQRYALAPAWGDLYGSGHVGTGLSVGTNGISVYEHAASHMPPTLVYAGDITGWHHVVVNYENKTPKLYVDGLLVKTGYTSAYSTVHPGPDGSNGTGIGGMIYGYFDGQMDDVRVYNRTLLDTEITSIYNIATDSNAPSILLSSNSRTIISGESFVLTWSAKNVDTCSASGGWSGVQGTSGSQMFSPAVTTTYALSCSGTQGNVVESITITVVPAPENSLAAHWPFDDGAGLVAADGSGNSNDASLVNMSEANWVPGKINSALNFDGVDDYLSGISALDVSNNFTMALWVSPESTHEIDTQATSGIVGVFNQKYAIGAPYGDYYWGAGHSGAGVSVGTNGISVYEHAASYMPPLLVYSGAITGWNHVVVVYENKTPKLYLNGSLVATGYTSSKSFVHPGPVADSGLGGMGFGYFDGQMDEVRIYNRTLSESEIVDLYNDELIAPPPSPSLASAIKANRKVTLSWTPISSATGYRVHYGTAPGVYTESANVGNITEHTVNRLTNGTEYYFAVAAYNNDNKESIVSNELAATPQPTMIVKNIVYNVAGQITSIEYGNGTVTTHTYDPLSFQLTRIYTVDSSSAVIQDLNYTYDPAGNVLEIIDNLNTASQSFQYDDQNRLTQAVNPATYGTKTYAYDEVGNITQKDGKVYTYDGIAGGPHAVTETDDGITRTTYTYDPNGNMISKQIDGGDLTLYTYDTENRLIDITKNAASIATYTYDGDGGRTSKTTADGTTRFIGSMYEETNGRATNYIFLGSTRVASITNGSFYYYHQDHLGGTNVLTGSDGTVKEIIEYQPFGKESRKDRFGTPEEVAHYYFTNHFKDDESGLIFMQARYYDPELARFITADTIVQNPTNPQTLNRYAYANNNPVNYVDPSGHGWFKKLFGKIFGAIAGITYGLLTGDFFGGFQIYNMINSTFTAATTGNWGAWAAGIAGGLVGGAIGKGLAGNLAGSLGGKAFTFGGGFAIGAVEFGIAGFGAGFGSALGGGASFGDAAKAGAIGGAIGAVTGGLIEGTYLSGMQGFAHGLSKNEVSAKIIEGAFKGKIDSTQLIQKINANKSNVDVLGEAIAKINNKINALETLGGYFEGNVEIGVYGDIQIGSLQLVGVDSNFSFKLTTLPSGKASGFGSIPFKFADSFSIGSGGHKALINYTINGSIKGFKTPDIVNFGNQGYIFQSQ